MTAGAEPKLQEFWNGGRSVPMSLDRWLRWLPIADLSSLTFGPRFSPLRAFFSAFVR